MDFTFPRLQGLIIVATIQMSSNIMAARGTIPYKRGAAKKNTITINLMDYNLLLSAKTPISIAILSAMPINRHCG